MADGGHFEFWALTGSAHLFARGTPANFFTYPSRKTNPSRNKALLSTVTELLQTTLLYIHNLIKSTLHTVRTVHMCKVGLSAYDTKRWLCEDAIHTHAHGHRSLSPRRGRRTCSPQVKNVVKVTLIIDYFEILKFYVITFDEYGKFF